jgi:hypothetical protein
VGWLLDAGFGGTAGIQDGADCIGMSLGTVHTLRNLFLAMLSHPTILTNIGDASLEENKAQRLPDNITDFDDFSASIIPRDKLRLQYASELFSCAFNFIFQHEIGHLFLGHIDWINSKTNQRALSEMCNPEKIPPLDLQTFEVEADCFSAIDVFNEKLKIRSFGGRLCMSRTNSFGSPKNAIFGVFFSIYSVFRLFSGKRTMDDNALLSIRHPPALYRQRFLLASLLDYALEHKVISGPELGEACTLAFEHAEHAFGVLTSTPALKSAQFTEAFDRSNKLLDQLRSNRKRIGAELDVLRRGG